MTNKIKVLHIIGSLRIGGAENIAMNFVRYLDPDKFQCDYLVFGETIGQYEEEATLLGAKVIHIPEPQKSYKEYVANFKRIVKYEGYDIVHSHTLLNNGLNLFIATMAGVKKRISHSHSTEAGKEITWKYKIYRYTMKKLINKFSTHYIACGEQAGRYLYGEKLFADKGILLANGIDTNKYKYNKNTRIDIRKKMGIDEKLVIGHIGRLVEVKNHRFLLDVFQEIAQDIEQVQLLIIGEGELRECIEENITKLKLENKVMMLGERTDISELLQAMDVLIFPSLYEGVPVTLIEAQVAGLPCIVSNRVSEEVKIVDNMQFVGLDENISKWKEKVYEQIKRIREDNSEKVKEKGFDFFENIKEIEKIYEG